MHILITGASGFVGSHLSRALLDKNRQVTGIGTSRDHFLAQHAGFTWISADTTQPGPWQDAVPRADVIVNLAGRTIFKRWTRAYKKQMQDSRILTTRNLVAALPADCGTLFLSTSAVGLYGSRGDDILTEEAPAGADFLASLSNDWESEARPAEKRGARVALMRFGVVLAVGGGALGKMVPAFRMFAGGPLGNGRHWFPWIHMSDLIGAIEFLISRENLDGPFNFVAPGQIRHVDFARTLGKSLGSPAFMPAPAFMLRLLLGEMGNTLLSSQRAVPDRLQQAGFDFRFPDAAQALANLFAK
ncbi:MAG: TIGR01777 family protein [Desulfobacterales bacterium]|nr:TIGR01777 family protein [Desulfobacterales bacterium]